MSLYLLKQKFVKDWFCVGVFKSHFHGKPNLGQNIISGHKRTSKKPPTIEEVATEKAEYLEVQNTGENVDDVNLDEELIKEESTSIKHEDDKLLINETTTVGTNGLMKNRKEEAAAVKDSKLMNTSNRYFVSLICNILSYLLLLLF